MAIPSITIIGSLNTDLITRTTRVPAAGETLISQSFSTGSGGKGANQAVACARLSRKNATAPVDIAVRMIGAVGDDTFGHDLLEDLQSNGIETDGVAVKKGERSGVAVIIVEEQSGENRILMSPNANFSLRPNEFMQLRSPRLDLIVLQLEIPLDTTLQILKIARENGVEVVMNPAPAQKLPKEAWEGVTHLIVNESEASIITDCAEEQPSWRKWGKHMECIVSLGVEHVTITLGPQGAIYMDTRLRQYWYHPAKQVKVVDTTAAGDTFVGAYAVAITKQWGRSGNVAAAVRWAIEAAAKTVAVEGAQAAIPWLEQIDTFDESRIKLREGTGFESWSRGVD